jgi:hypothetical protein
MEYFKIVGPVESFEDGRTVVTLQLEKNASDWLCKAMSFLVTKTQSGSADADHLPKYEQLQKEVIKAWEQFHP